jgi:uncharacterized integral membrane protein
MWLLRSILAFAGIAVLLAFAISNLDQRVTVVLFTTTYRDVHLNLVIFCAALFGAALSFAVMIFREFSLRTTIRRLRRENMRLDDELVALRNLPLTGLQSTSQAQRPPSVER